MPDPSITSFRGEYRFLSNFYPRKFYYQGRIWRTAEHVYQASKAADISDYLRISKLRTPGEAKRAGQRVELRKDWERTKRRVMLGALRAKFRDAELAERLRGTGDAELIEGNSWGDTYWGQSPIGYGFNHLGRLLMQVREEVRVRG